MKLRLLIYVGLVIFYLKDASGSSLADDLARQSSQDGLSIAFFEEGSTMGIIRLDGKGRISLLRVPGLDYVYDVKPINQVLLAANKSFNDVINLRRRGILGPIASSIALYPLDGPLKSTGLPFGIVAGVVSPKLDQVAALISTTDARHVSLRYGPLDWTSSREVFSLVIKRNYYDPENFSWSPDERYLVYSDNGRVYIFDTINAIRRSIGEGSDPCWSPDGTSIAYVSQNHDLMLHRVGTRRVSKLTRFYNVAGFPRWSPDSRYVLFTESNPLLALRNLRTLPATEFMVIRVSDGATATVFAPGMGADNRRFFWLKVGSRATTRVPQR